MTMKKIILYIVLFTSVVIIAQTKKNKAVTLQEDLKTNITAVIPFDTLLFAPVISGNKILYTASGNKIVCADTLGKNVWMKQFTDKAASEPIINESITLLGFANGDLTKIKNETGETIESVGMGDSIVSNLLKINYHWPSELMIPKSGNMNDAAVFCTSNGTIHCIDIETLQEYWSNNNLKIKIKSDLTLVKDKIIFIGDDNSIFCLDAKNGLLIWRWKGNDEIVFVNREIFSAANQIYLITSNKLLFALDVILGKLEWTLENYEVENAMGVEISNKNIFVFTTDKRLLLISLKTQKVIDQIQFPQNESQHIAPPLDVTRGYLTAIDSTIYRAEFKTNKIYSTNFGNGIITRLIKISENKFIALTDKKKIIIFETRYE